jgi:uncharacterized protein with HEPN domain
MYDMELARTILEQIYGTLHTIQRRFATVTSPDFFTASDVGMEKLDALCMQLVALGEGVRSLDKVTGGTLLVQYPQVEWKRVMGMRDVISHHYFDVDAEIVYSVCADHIPEMISVVNTMLNDIGVGRDG